MTKRSNISLFWYILSVLLELVGIASIVYGFSLFSPVLGFIFGGIGLILVAFAIDPPIRHNKPGE